MSRAKKKPGRFGPCLGCGKEIYIQRCRDESKLNRKRFCSKDCYIAYKRRPEYQIAFFMAKVRKTDTCWLFEGCIGHEGYGSYSTGDRANGTSKQHQSHRYSWLIHNGEIPSDKLVLHTCDVRNCVNPAHLYLGDRFDNARDMLQRGRFHRPGKPLLWPELSKRAAAAAPLRSGEKE